jgi:hypothetical protein
MPRHVPDQDISPDKLRYALERLALRNRAGKSW